MRVGGRREGARERAEGGGALDSSHNARTRGRSSTSTSHTLLPPSFSQVNGYMTAVDVWRISRGGYIGDTALQEEASARRGRYGAVLEASYSPIGG